MFVGASKCDARWSSTTVVDRAVGRDAHETVGPVQRDPVAAVGGERDTVGVGVGELGDVSGSPAEPSARIGTRTTRSAFASTTTSAAPSGVTRQPFG